MPDRLRSRPVAIGLAVLALLVAIAVAVALTRPDDEVAVASEPTVTTAGTTPTTAPPSTDVLPATDATALHIPDPPYEVATPVAEGQLAIYDQPWGAPVRTLEHPKLINGDPNAAVPLSLLVKGHSDDGWTEVYLPVRPNGSTGWVRDADVSTYEHSYRIEVALAEFTLRLYDGDEVMFEAPIAVAANNTPTPGGLYYTTELIRPPDAPDGAYGSYAYGLSGYSDVFQSFNGGPGQLGIHGTNQPQLMGQQVSHGCIRMRNEDIDQLAEQIGLPLGVPVVVLS